MSGLKHTPGPWSVQNTSDIFTDLAAKNAEGIEAPSDDGWMIADCDMGCLNLDEVTANARLIAASPRMYGYIKNRADAGDLDAAAIINEVSNA